MTIDRSKDVTAPMTDFIQPAPRPLVIKSYPAHRNNYLYSRPGRVITFVVIHCTDGHEGSKQDDTNVAAMFAERDLFPRRSCHYVVDMDSATQCVPDESVAWHCGSTGNLRGLGIEICGLARQSRAEWLDNVSKSTLGIAARLTLDLCQKYNLALQLLPADALRAGHNGITTHAAVSAAWRESSHTDPGANFPMDAFMRAVNQAASQ